MECRTFDPVLCAVGAPMAPTAQAHVAACALCAEEVTELVALLRQVPLGEELAAAYAAIWPPRLIVARSGRFGPLPGALGVDEAGPVLADESSAGGTWAHFEALEWATMPGPREALRLQVTTPQGQFPKGQLIPIGWPVRVRYALDEDGEVLVVHRDGAGALQLLFPTPTTPNPHWPAGTASFEGTIEGRHGERQQFVVLATKTRVLPDPFPFDGPVPLARLYRAARTRAAALPPDHWCEAIWPYTAVALSRVDYYRCLTDLGAFEAACLREIHDKGDWAKTACGEVCHRVLTAYATASEPVDPALHALFVAITERLIRYWVGHRRGTWDETVLQDTVQAVYSEFFATARRRPLAFTSTVELQDGTRLPLPCYTALLAYLRTITLRQVLAEWRQQRRAEQDAFLRRMHRQAALLTDNERACVQRWASAHLGHDTVQQALLAGALRGLKPKALLAQEAVLRRAYAPVGTHKLANDRDGLLRRVYTAIRCQQPPEVIVALRNWLARTSGEPPVLDEDEDEADG